MRIDFDPVDHSYTSEYGQIFIPVTTLCSITPRAVNYNSLPNRKAVEEARERGSFIHKEIEDFVKYGTEGMSEVFQWFKRILYPMFTDWQSEVLVYSDSGETAYAGQIDLVARNKDRYIIIDLKNGGHSTVDYQTSFYARAYAENHNIDINLIDRACIDARIESHIEFFRVRVVPDEWLDDVLKCYAYELPYIEPLPVLKGFTEAQISQLMKLEAYVSTLESELEKMKNERDDFRNKLFVAMNDAMIDTFELPTVRITRVKDTESDSFDSKSFKAENPELYKKYLTKIRKKGYLKVTLRDITKKETK